MALRAKVLQKKSERFEKKKLQLFKIPKEQVSALELLLQDVYTSHRPKPSDYDARRDLISVFNEIAKKIYGSSKDIPIVVEFGSFVMDLFSPSSDLDLSVNFSYGDATFPREKKIQTLRKFARMLYAIQRNGHVSRVLPVTSAKVPILKCVDRGTGVECDISVENRDGVLKSHVIRIISSIDQRFHMLSFLMKTWAKAHNINSSKDKTLNSLSIILLVAFHLQTRNPPILPPFSAIFKDGTDPAIVEKSISKFANYGKANNESLAELFVTLLIKLSSVEKLWPKGLCVSTRNALWTSKTWDSKVACISVEDFSDPTQNVSRAVGPGEVKQIYKCIDASLRIISSFMDGQMSVQVKDLLFGQEGNSGAVIPRNLRPKATVRFPSKFGKRKRQAMRYHSAAPNKTNAGRGYTTVMWGQVEQNMAVESVKKTGTEGARRGGVSGGGWETAAVRSESIGGRWGATTQTQWGGSTGGWGGRSTGSSGWETTPKAVDKPGGWGGSWEAGTGGGSWNINTK